VKARSPAGRHWNSKEAKPFLWSASSIWSVGATGADWRYQRWLIGGKVPYRADGPA
jgi:hypothetical protein